MKKTLIKLLFAALVTSTVTACKKTFEKLPETELDATVAYQTVDDANAAVMGLYGRFMSLADRYVILNELRGDLLQYTDNADADLREISNHTVSENNPYASPRPYYELIINCNDVLHNFKLMYEQKKLKEAEYFQRYSDIACLRSFLYLQLGIHYGDEVRYVTDPLADINAIKDVKNFPKITFDALLDSLINFTEAIPFKTQYTAQVSGTVGPALNMTLDGIPTNTFFIQKKMFLGELYLWKGDYVKAATYYREVMELGTPSGSSEAGFGLYKLAWGGAGHYVGYTTINNQLVLNDDVSTWRGIFNRGYDASYGYEWLWALPYDSKFLPDNPLIKLFSPIGGDYLLKPSQSIMDNWNAQQQVSRVVSNTSISYGAFNYDARGRYSVRTISGKPVVMKYLYYYLDYLTNIPTNPFAKNGRFYLYRQSQLHLHFAEAANRAGYHKLACAMADGSIASTYPAPSGVTDLTLYQNTLNLPAPFDFDARYSDNVPYYRGQWYRHVGVRNRAGIVRNVVLATDSLTQIENNIINEEALENAFEGTRWPDLIRIARRRNDPAFLANKVYDKLVKEGVPNADAIRQKLMTKANWYLPFKM